MPEFSDINLAVLVKIVVPNYSEPIIIKKYFKVGFNQISLPGWDFPQTEYLKDLDELSCCFPMSEYYQGKLKEELNDRQTNTHTAQEITLLPGFVGDPNFIAEAIEAYPSFGNTSISGSPVTFNCYQSTLKSAKVEETFGIADLNTLDQNNDQNILKIYPNPSSGRFEVISNTNEIISLKVFTLAGKIIFENAKIFSSISEVDLSKYSNGQYILQISTTKNIIHKMIIKN